MKASENYLAVMADSLEKKIVLLQKISEINVRQKGILEAERVELDDFNATVEEKGRLVEELERLDSGFEAVYDRIRAEISEKRTEYAEQIAEIKRLITQITELNVKVQAEETRNKELVQNRFQKMREGIRDTRKNNRAVANYYKSMSKLDSSPQFLDKKK